MAVHRYTLRRLNWRRSGPIVGEGRVPGGYHGWLRLPGSVRVATFADAAAADAERRRLEGEARAVINPFRCGSALHEQTSFDEGRLCDWLLDHRLTPPAGRCRDWVRWYDKGRPAMDGVQREKVWEALDRVRFYEVSEGPVRPLVFVAVAVPWDFTGGSDGHFFTDDEGGAVRHVFRTRGEAERFCRGKWAEGLYEDEWSEMTDRRHLRDDPLGLHEAEEVWFGLEAPEYEIVEVEVMD